METIEAGGCAPPVLAKSPRRMKQPAKDELRRLLAVAEARIAYLEAPWWARLLGRIRAWR